MTPIILGIDPGTKYLGMAVTDGQNFLGGGVHTLHNGHRPHDVIGQARKVVLSYVVRFSPKVVAIERPLLFPTKRAALVSVIAEELRARSSDLGMAVHEVSARDARRKVLGNERATKFEVAHALVRMGFSGLREKLPQKPPHPVLGYGPKELYWLHLFDALAVALAVARTVNTPWVARWQRERRPAEHTMGRPRGRFDHPDGGRP
jgi:Holliday junction resolvasome RuvABC endonuclease subunit